MSSANDLNLDKSKILSPGHGLNNKSEEDSFAKHFEEKGGNVCLPFHCVLYPFRDIDNLLL